MQESKYHRLKSRLLYIFETDVFYSLCPKVENFQVCNMQDIGGFAICGLIKRKESQLTIQKRGSSSDRGILLVREEAARC